MMSIDSNGDRTGTSIESANTLNVAQTDMLYPRPSDRPVATTVFRSIIFSRQRQRQLNVQQVSAFHVSLMRPKSGLMGPTKRWPTGRSVAPAEAT